MKKSLKSLKYRGKGPKVKLPYKKIGFQFAWLFCFLDYEPVIMVVND